MKKLKINTGFSKFTDAELDVKADEIITKMTGNVNFTNPIPALADVNLAKTAYSSSLVKAANGNTNDTATKNQKRSLLEGVLGRLGLYVQLTANENEDALFSSGFDLQKAKEFVGVLAKPENLRATPGKNIGGIKLVVNSIPGADSYLFEYTETPVTEKSVWQIIPSSKASLNIDGLISGKQYAFRVTGVGANPITVFSDVVTSFIL
jgi:hypothetical protein